MNKTEEKITALTQPVVEQLGFELWDVEYLLEAGRRILRLTIDSRDPAVPISINDCENVSRTVDPILDEADPIAESYYFEVSSAGAERQLKRPSDFERFIGSQAELKLYKAVNGVKTKIGCLEAYDNGNVTIDGATFSKELIASVRLRVDY